MNVNDITIKLSSSDSEVLDETVRKIITAKFLSDAPNEVLVGKRNTETFQRIIKIYNATTQVIAKLQILDIPKIVSVEVVS